MAAAFDHFDPLLRSDTGHGKLVEPTPDGEQTPHRLSFAGMVDAESEFATTSQDVLRRELRGWECGNRAVIT
ncbi:hypothetical protein [Nocardia cyriacigeorgica]|uniref:hypothetical protein n=1 Tax=Nocardia cyriacigeorgica TaxID=135487 RepID=UPI00189369DA|nr:hypothetical protein [Nocardia cyriacigeorgica]MBF6413194.1 hypothetical protein [Nocardia cyriacigeorgica]